MTQYFFKRHLLRTSILGLLLTVMIGAVCGQETTSLTGLVTDPGGQAVAGATVTLTDLDAGAKRTTTTNAGGIYQFSQLRPGAYALRVEAQGFKTVVHERLQLLVATPATLNLRLEIGQITEQIKIEAETTATLNTTDATMGAALKEKEVKQLPFLARNPVNLLTLQPGVVFTGQSDTDLLFSGSIEQLDEREGVVNGVLGNQTNIKIDGIDANDWQNQAAFASALPLTLDSLQEFRVTTATPNSTDGGAAAAQVQLVTKSGSNSFHGNARFYNRDDRFAANSFFNNAVGLPKPALERNIFGGSLGGRLRRDRAFFFADYEGRLDSSEETVLRTVPTESFRSGILTYRTMSGNIARLTPADLQAIDPLKKGVNPAMLNMFSLYPQGNDPSAGDGLNFTGLRFNSPVETNNNIYTARFDFNLTKEGRHVAFWRGTLGDIKRDLIPAQFPGLTPNSVLLNNSKGFVAGYIAQLNNRMINTLNVGLTRLGIEQTGSPTPDWALGRSISSLGNTSRAVSRQIGAWEVRDDLSWTRGRHSTQFGASLRFIRARQNSQQRSFPVYTTDGTFCCNKLADVILGDGNPANDPALIISFLDDAAALYGVIDGLFGPSVYADPRANSILPVGSSLRREFAENQYDFYAQDSWRIRPNLTLTAGLRYGYATPPWEVNGAQVRPTLDVRDWWNTRQRDMLAGRPADAAPLMGFELAGKANDAPGWWEPDKNNFAPRVALAWSPNFKNRFANALLGQANQSAIRAGFGINYHRVGGPVSVIQDLDGNFGLSTRLSGPFDLVLGNAPRFSGNCGLAAGCSGFPPPRELAVNFPSGVSFPAIPPTDFSAFSFMVDNRLKTPYTMNFTFSIQRQLPKGVSLDVAYVGTQGRKLLQKLELAQYSGLLTDPASGATLWQAMNRAINLIGPDPFNPAINPLDAGALSRIQPIAFVENLLSNLPAFLADSTGNPFFRSLTPTQAFYSHLARNAPNYGSAIGFGFDAPFSPGSPWSRSVDPEQNGFVILNPQYSGLLTWFGSGSSSYHSLQISLRKNVGRSLFGFNYVLSKSIDNGSSAENGDVIDTFFTSLNGQAPNSLATGAHRAVSDFDLRHNFNAHWVIDLPIGRGRAIARDATRLLDRLVGGWQLAGVWRWRSGLPLTTVGVNRANFIFTRAPATATGEIESGRDGEALNIFADPEDARSKLIFTRPGEAGSRNIFRAPGYFNVDLGINKGFQLPWGEGHRIEFRWTAFNAFNNVNFSANGINLSPLSPTFGRIMAAAGPRGGAREMEFALRYEF